SDRDGNLGGGAAITAGSLSHGQHTITARVTDQSGQAGETRIALVVASPPVVTITAPADGTAFVPGVPAAFTAAASEVGVGDLTAAIAWRSSLGGSLGTGGRLDIATLRSGTHTITATVIDAGGKRATAAITVVVNAAPTVAITAPTAGSSFVPGEPVRLAAAA